MQKWSNWYHLLFDALHFTIVPLKQSLKDQNKNEMYRQNPKFIIVFNKKIKTQAIQPWWKIKLKIV